MKDLKNRLNDLEENSKDWNFEMNTTLENIKHESNSLREKQMSQEQNINIFSRRCDDFGKSIYKILLFEN